jgi:hypothetical protein
MCRLTVNGNDFNNETVVYVVDDTDLDISCDVVLGRHTLARSRYRLIDTLHARLYNADDEGEYIQCTTCRPHTRNDGKRDLLPTPSTPTPNHHKHNHLATMKIEIIKKERRPRYTHQQQQRHQLNVIRNLLFPHRINNHPFKQICKENEQGEVQSEIEREIQ